MPAADVVLVFPHKPDPSIHWGADVQDEEVEGLRPPTASEKHQMEAWQVKRTAIIAALRETGLTVTPFFSRSREEIFLKLVAEEQQLREVAEVRRHKLQLRPEYLSAYAEYKSDNRGRRELKYRDRHAVSHMYGYHGGESTDEEGAASSPASIFRTVDRIQLVDHIVRSHDHGCAGLDISEIMHSSDVLQYFPLHEGRRLVELDADWFRAFALGTRIDRVREYFGERLAMRFLFLSQLHMWLVVPALLGPVLWLLDLLAGSPANGAPALRCAAVGLWAALLGHCWQRAAARYALRWGTLEASRAQEPMRPEFVGVSRLSPVSGQVERHYPWAQRFRRVALSGGVVALALALLGVVALVLLTVRRGLLEHQGRLPFQAACALTVEALGGAFSGLAKGLTDRENHRTASEHAAHLLAKTVVFRFVICYAPLYYTAFFKERGYLLGMQTSCVNDDCLGDLGVQLAVFVLVRIVVQHVGEFVLPLFCLCFWGTAEGHGVYSPLFSGPAFAVAGTSRAERESRREQPDLHEDMDSTLILFGYTAFFSAACPVVPSLALVSCLLGCFIDHKKLLLVYQRPFPLPAANNEPWDTAFGAFGCIALATNAALAVFSSQSFAARSYHVRILTFVAIEHALIGVQLLVSVLWPAMPDSVLMQLLQQRAFVREHFSPPGGEEVRGESAAASASASGPALRVFERDEDDEDDMWR